MNVLPRRHRNIGDDWKWFAGGLVAAGAVMGATGKLMWDLAIHRHRA